MVEEEQRFHHLCFSYLGVALRRAIFYLFGDLKA